MFRTRQENPMVSLGSICYTNTSREKIKQDMCMDDSGLDEVSLVIHPHNPPVDKRVKVLKSQHVVRSPGGNKTWRLRRS